MAGVARATSLAPSVRQRGLLSRAPIRAAALPTGWPSWRRSRPGCRRALRGSTRSRTISALRQAEEVPDHLLTHLSPLGWEHVNLTGDYIWGPEQPITKNHDGLRPLR